MNEPRLTGMFPQAVQKDFNTLWLVDKVADKPVDDREKIFYPRLLRPQGGDFFPAFLRKKGREFANKAWFFFCFVIF